MLIRFALAAALFAAPSFALAGETVAKPDIAPAAKTETSKAEAQPSEKLICRRAEATGSRTARGKLCLTKKQWKEYDRAA